MAVHMTLRNRSSLRCFPQATTVDSFAYSSPRVHLHALTILFYIAEGDHPRPSTLQGQLSHGHRKECPHGAIPVNIGVRSPPLLVHSSRDSPFLLAYTQFFVSVHFRFVDREGRQRESFGLFYLCPRDSPHLFPQWVVTSAPCCRPLQDLRDMRYIIIFLLVV